MTRVNTGIVELDKILNGGFMRGDTAMIAGGAGTGKTTFALQYLVNGIAEFGERGLYVTFEQLPDQIYRDAESFGWDLRKMENENKLMVMCTSPDVLLEPAGKDILGRFIDQIRPSRVVMDSLSHIAMFVPERELRREAYRLLMYLKTKRVTTIATYESSQTGAMSLSATETGLSFLVDCVILLRFVEIESSLRKALVITKMRGSGHDKRLREFEITSQGIKVAEPFTQYEGILTGAPRRSMAEAFTDAFKKQRRS